MVQETLFRASIEGIKKMTMPRVQVSEFKIKTFLVVIVAGTGFFIHIFIKKIK